MSNETIEVEFKSKSPLCRKLLPLILTVVVIIADQITKYLVEEHIARNTIGISFFGDFLRFIRVYNPGIAFSMLNDLSSVFRWILLCIVPLLVLFVILGIFIRNEQFTTLQRWAIAGILGGGFGNLIDRFFRAEGVVDFISVKFYGFLGFDYWPTFNVADSAVVVCGILLIISFAVSIKNENKKESSNDKD